MTSIALKADDKQERNNRTISVILTLLIHGVLLLFLLYYIIITPIPPYPVTQTPELELDFGGGGGGSGNVAASSIGAKASTENKMNQIATQPSSNTPTVNNDVEPSTPVPSNLAKKIPKIIDTVPKPPHPSLELANAENKFKNAKGSNGGIAAQGEQGKGGGGNGAGQGAGNGPGTGSGPGGNGEGFNFNLNGRKLLHRPDLKSNNPIQGQIVVGITVDQDGNVTEATPGVRGSTITDASLYILVKNAAMKTKFSPSSSDTPEQTGTITFVFTIQ
jgi:outer membrane biosynthesis protein TonB